MFQTVNPGNTRELASPFGAFELPNGDHVAIFEMPFLGRVAAHYREADKHLTVVPYGEEESQSCFCHSQDYVYENLHVVDWANAESDVADLMTDSPNTRRVLSVYLSGFAYADISNLGEDDGNIILSRLSARSILQKLLAV